MERIFNLIMSFRKSPGMDLLVLVLCTLYVTIPPMSPFTKYDIIKNGIITQGDLIKSVKTPLGKTLFSYTFKTKDNQIISPMHSSLSPDDYKIDYKSTPNKIEIKYVPNRPERHWLNFDHGYKAETFWRDYIMENGVAILVLHIIIMIIIHIDLHLKKRKRNKVKGYKTLPDLSSTI